MKGEKGKDMYHKDDVLHNSCHQDDILCNSHVSANIAHVQKEIRGQILNTDDFGVLDGGIHTGQNNVLHNFNMQSTKTTDENAGFLDAILSV